MSWKVANIRLELDEPEQALPEKLAARLGVGPEGIAHYRILRKSLDARRHDDLHFVYAAEVDVPGDGATPRGEKVAEYVPERFDWPAPGRRRWNIGRSSSGRGRRGCSPGTCWRWRDIGP